MEFEGTLKFTNVFAAISTMSPMLTFPITVEFNPIYTLFPIVGAPCSEPAFMFPIVAPFKIVRFFPATVLLLNVTQCGFLKLFLGL